MATIAALENELNSFDPNARRNALRELKFKADAGEVDIPAVRPAVNLHAHTFFSFNGYGYSPSRFAWEAYKAGLEVAGTVDFDVLDAVGEILEAGDILGLKTTAGLETRVYFPEYAEVEITSPGEPGIAYFMGVGFVEEPPAGSPAASTLDDMRRRAGERTRGMMERINAALGDVQLDYEKDVLPLTPKGNATERHLLEAYTRKSAEVFEFDDDRIAAFWANALQEPEETVRGLMGDKPKLHELIRKKLMKAGGVGYVKPDAGSFPLIDDVIQMVRECGAVPTQTWLDGLSEGERDMEEQLRLLMSKGVEALNIIPDRNWNIADPEEKERKVAKLREVIEVARVLQLPIVVGTELNKPGQKLVDTFDAPELRPFREDFIKGARIMWGHTIMRRAGKFGYVGRPADEIFGPDRGAKNAFFGKIGEMKPGGNLTHQVIQASEALWPHRRAKVAEHLA